MRDNQKRGTIITMYSSCLKGYKKQRRENMADQKLLEKINKLREEKNAVILAHYYVDGEVQALADYVGDSYFLAKLATTIDKENIILCGVNFMGESAKLLNPGKNVILADELADCPMAHMVEIEKIEQVRREYPDVAVVCYVNSTAEIKAHSDVCVTSSNALRVVKNIKNKQIFFIPDNNLGRYISKMLPEKEFIFHDGFCHVHKSITKEAVEKAKEVHPQAQVLAHPECTGDVLELADFIGSTSEIIDYATESEAETFIIGTEMGILYELEQKNPNKKFYSVGHRQFCPNMKRITVEKVAEALETLEPKVVVPDEIAKNAAKPLQKMMELAK